MAFWNACAFRHKFLAPLATCLCLALPLAARGEPATNPSPVAEAQPAGDTNVIATYDGGSITAGDVAEYLDEPHFVADAEQSTPPNAAFGQQEKLARHLAAVRILVKAARAKGLAGPGWRLETKLIEGGVLAQALVEEIRRTVLVTDQELNDQYRTNRFKLLGMQTIEAARIGISAKKHGANALARANEALAAIRAGQDFAAVARQYSDLDPKTAQKDIYPPTFWGKGGAAALAELGEGKVSDPLPVEDGFELVKVDRINLPGNAGPEEAKAALRVRLAEPLAAERVGEMEKAAIAAFPFVATPTNSLPSTLNPQPSTPNAPPSTLNPQPSTNLVLMSCGQFLLTTEDARGLAAERYLHLDDQQLVATIERENTWRIQMGELARSLGFDKRPDVQKAVRCELDKQLALKARERVRYELAAQMPFPESRIRDIYDQNFTATLDALLQYDVLIVPTAVPPNATAEARETARTNALARAQDLIQRIQGGASFDTLAGSEAGVRLLSGQSRVVPDSSALAPLVAGLNPGEVAAQPYNFEDFGGYGVIRVKQYDPRRKQPYNIARNYILVSLRDDAMPDLMRHFESFLLDKYHFAFGPPATARTRDPASAPNPQNQPPPTK